jgi:hypothetical protein
MKHTTLKHTGQSTQNTCNQILIPHLDSYYRHSLPLDPFLSIMAWRIKLCYFSTYPEQNGILNVRDRGAEREWGPICQFGAEQKTWRHKGRRGVLCA